MPDPTPEITALADQGEAILAARDDEQRLEQEAAALERRASWDALLECAGRCIAPLVWLLPAEPPEGFLEYLTTGERHGFRWSCTPFGNVPLAVAFLRTNLSEDPPAWVCRDRREYGGDDHRFLSFPAAVRPLWQSDELHGEGKWLPQWRDHDRIDDLAEALARCRRLEKDYAACLEECRTKPVPDHLQPQPDPEPPPSVEALSLLAALDAYLDAR